MLKIIRCYPTNDIKTFNNLTEKYPSTNNSTSYGMKNILYIVI